MESFNEMWELVLEEIKKNISETIYRVWLSTLTLVNYDGASAVLCTEEFRIKVIEKQFLGVISSAFEAVTGIQPEIQFVKADPDAGAPASKSSSYEEKNEDEENTFDTFVVGATNRFAHAAALAVAEKPGASKNYNPLFIYGNSGLGKTHLMRAIGHKILQNNPNANVIYTTGEEFINLIVEGTQAGKVGTMQNIHEKYRNADVLLVDDVQFIAGKDMTQVEFFHTFDALRNDNKQIVLTSDRPPKEMKKLDERLSSRFEWGLLADIQAPDIETRMAIIRRKAAALELEIPNDAVEFLAENIKNNVRQLEGAVKRLKAYSTFHGVTINLATAQGAVKDILSGSVPAPVTVEKIINEVARTYGADPAAIRSKKKDASTVGMRQLAMYIIREMTNLSLDEIGKEFGGKDHTTVMHALDVVKRKLESDSSLQATIEDVKKNIGE